MPLALNDLTDGLRKSRGIAYLSSEDFYHAGQVGFIRLATDPSWEYYGQIYGG